MTRTEKWTVHEASSEPKWFTHNGYFGTDPTKVKKNGAGKGNWGRVGDELLDSDIQFNMFGKSQRRNSNHQENERFIKEKSESIESHYFKDDDRE
ncbi:ATPase stabilizing factor 15 kDa protein [Yamadazyma tenuis]|uniref:ATPase stabilizing factor 15 kDa protein n=1 Tax=Candida tenuis TaxID=2315449 RepID=UPI002798564F|nr:ATPase stabilizing factor 15 kDa protein [Yamadazyma tenuis]